MAPCGGYLQSSACPGLPLELSQIGQISAVGDARWRSHRIPFALPGEGHDHLRQIVCRAHLDARYEGRLLTIGGGNHDKCKPHGTSHPGHGEYAADGPERTVKRELSGEEAPCEGLLGELVIE